MLVMELPSMRTAEEALKRESTVGWREKIDWRNASSLSEVCVRPNNLNPGASVLLPPECLEGLFGGCCRWFCQEGSGGC